MSKRPKNTYTEEEESQMAVYVYSRLPRLTEPKAADWAEFAKSVSGTMAPTVAAARDELGRSLRPALTRQHPARTTDAWVEHYRAYRSRIEALVKKLGGKIPGKRDPASARRRVRSGSEESVEYIEDREEVERAMKKKRVEYVLSDSDDEL
jgi:hypothetical protein